VDEEEDEESGEVKNGEDAEKDEGQGVGVDEMEGREEDRRAGAC